MAFPAAAALSLLAWAGVAEALFTGWSSTSGSFATVRLEPPSDLAVTWSCPVRKQGYTAELTWSPSPTTRADQYVVTVADRAAGPFTLLAATTGTTTVDLGVKNNTDRWYRVTATAGGWESAPVELATRSPKAAC